MRKRNLLFFIIAITAMVCIYSCDNESNTLLLDNEGIELIKVNTSNENFQELNNIPKGIAAKMDKEELAVWTLISSKFYVNYDVIESKYYKNHKEQFLLRLRDLYDRIADKNERPARLFFISERNSNIDERLATTFLEDSTDVGGGGDGEVGGDTAVIDDSVDEKVFVSSRVASYELGGTEILLRGSGYVHITGTKKKPKFEWSNLGYDFIVAETSSKEEKEFSPSFDGKIKMTAEGNEVHIKGEGTLFYREYSQKIQPDVYFGIAFEKNK